MTEHFPGMPSDVDTASRPRDSERARVDAPSGDCWTPDRVASTWGDQVYL
ncbi:MULTISPECIES: hypothetical protein [unclassified Rhodococcus (in: high G+C Gram-positive bacteria)]|nr:MULTISPECIES: hypothetical protein [unclassified Rhodococcus (in: high G+C Gram-positive bacteria)]MBC2638138.1 hypothetical protein [Rhodococcus sp. 3A]MBC2897118.1 hypothetical protein [Rhodococcus sp. 4CII]